MSNTSVMSALALVSLFGATAEAEVEGAAIALPEADMSAILAASSVGMAFSQDTAAQIDLFFASDYGYCDARKVAHVWNTDPFSAKAIIGGKIANGLTSLVDADIASTAGRVSCDWGELGLGWDQALALANYWGRSPGEAKAKAGVIASDLGHKGFMRTMAHVLEIRPIRRIQGGGDDAAYQRMFFQSEYGYCDALKVAHVWGTDVGASQDRDRAEDRRRHHRSGGRGHRLDGGVRPVQLGRYRAGFHRCQQSSPSFWGVSVGEAKIEGDRLHLGMGQSRFPSNVWAVFWLAGRKVSTRASGRFLAPGAGRGIDLLSASAPSGMCSVKGGTASRRLCRA